MCVKMYGKYVQKYKYYVSNMYVCFLGGFIGATV